MTEKQLTIKAWKTATGNQQLSSLLTAIGKAIRNARFKPNTFQYAHDLGRFSHRIASNRDEKGNWNSDHVSISCLDYFSPWRGEWYVANSDLTVYSTFQMWLDRYLPEREDQSIITGSIGHAMKLKRMQQAYDRYQKTGLRPDHCSLLEHMLWDVCTSRGDWISLYVQGKRPFGDSSIVYTIYEHCGWKMDWPDDEGPTEKHRERAWNIFDELAFAAPDAAKLAHKNIHKGK